MEDDDKEVNQESSPASTTEAQQPSDQQEAETTATQTPAAEETTQNPQQETQAQQHPPQDVDERGIPLHNVRAEYDRKLKEEIPRIIHQTVEEVMKGQQKKPEYTIEQLEQYAIENPQWRPWVESQKAQLIQSNLEKSIETRLQAKDQQTRDEMIQRQSESWVTTHPKFKDCFITDAGGAKRWNMTNPLSQLMGNYLNQVDPATGKLVKDRPDGLVIAAKMAFADHALNMEPKTTTQVNQLKKDLRKAQKSQMIPAGSTNAQTSPARSEVRKSLDNYNKSYNKSDIQKATRSYLVASGLIKEE